MSLVTMKEVLDVAEQRKTAIPAFSVDNLEIIEEVASVAEAHRYPAIMMVGQNTIRYNKFEKVSAIVRDVAASVDVPIVLHLDHGASYEQVIACLRNGFTSVMFDGSRLPLAENIAITKEIVRAAHSVGVSVEAELGAIGGVEDGQAGRVNIVDLEDARQFLDAVTVDALAIGIGNAHGIYKSTPNLAFDRLSEVAALGAPPLVLHGGSGIPDEMIRKAIRLGIRKINVATEVRNAFMEGLQIGLAHKDIYKMYMDAQAYARKVIEEKLCLFSSTESRKEA